MRITKDKMFGIDVIELTNQDVLDFLHVYKTSTSEVARKQAKYILTGGFIKLIASIAHKFQGLSQYDLEDLVYDGISGFNIALDKYDSNKNTKLITYAYSWIYQAIQRKVGLYKDIYVPEELRILNSKINEVIDIYKQSHEGVTPSRQYIAKTLNEPLKKVNNAIKACQAIYSLDRTMNDESDSSFIDTIADSSNIHKQVVMENDKSQIDNELKLSLSSNEYYVLIHFFGLNNNDKLQLNEIANNLNLSVARIKQLKLQAINKLRSNNTLQTMYW